MKPKPLDLEEMVDTIFTTILNFYGHARGEFRDVLKKEIKQRIKSACEFYLRYKDEPEELLKDFPELSNKKIALLDIFDEPLKFVTLRKFIEIIENLDYDVYVRQIDNSYNEWLFKYAFKSVFNEKESGKNEKGKIR